MSDHKDPQRISDAADNCEVLRARLAKYEDDQGNPKSQPIVGVEARPISDCLRGQFETWAMETDHPVFGYIGSDWLDHGDNPNTYANDYIQGAWVMFQRSAALADHLRQALRDLREALDPDDWMGEISMHAFIDAALALSAPSHGEQVGEDAKRLDFMLTKCRKVIVERLPHDNFEVYVEEGFLGDKRYPSVRYSGDWETGEPYALAIQREAIDAAMLAAAPSAGSQQGAAP